MEVSNEFKKIVQMDISTSDYNTILDFIAIRDEHPLYTRLLVKKIPADYNCGIIPVSILNRMLNELDDDYLLLQSSDTVTIVDTTTESVISEFRSLRRIISVKAHPIEPVIAIHLVHKIIMYHVFDGDIIDEVNVAVNDFCFSPDGSIIYAIVSNKWRGLLLTFDTMNMSQTSSIEFKKKQIYTRNTGCMMVSPDGKLLAFADDTIWPVNNKRIRNLYMMDLHSTDSPKLIYTGSIKCVRFLDSQTIGIYDNNKKNLQTLIATYPDSGGWTFVESIFRPLFPEEYVIPQTKSPTPIRCDSPDRTHIYTISQPITKYHVEPNSTLSYDSEITLPLISDIVDIKCVRFRNTTIESKIQTQLEFSQFF